MKKLSEAADSLLKKGEITKEEHDLLKQASLGSLIKTTKAAIPGGVRAGFYGLAGAALLQQLLQPLIRQAQAQQSYKNLIAKNPVLAGKDPEQIKDYFNVIKTFSPKAASNPLVAGSIVNKMMEFGGVDHKLVQDISSIQEGLSQTDALKSFTGAAAKGLMNIENTEEYGPE